MNIISWNCNQEADALRQARAAFANRSQTGETRDENPGLGRGEEANVTVAHSGEVKARVQVASERSDDPVPVPGVPGRQTRMVHTTYEVQVRNLRAGANAAADVRLSFNAGGYRVNVVSISPTPSEQHGDERVWDRTVAGGETATFRVSLDRTEDA
jgi:hypothetical protein